MVCKLLSANTFGTRPRPQETRHLAPRSEAPNLIKIRKQGIVVPGYATVDGARLGAFAGMLPADQCAQRAVCAFKSFPHQQGRDALEELQQAGGHESDCSSDGSRVVRARSPCLAHMQKQYHG